MQVADRHEPTRKSTTSLGRNESYKRAKNAPVSNGLEHRKEQRE